MTQCEHSDEEAAACRALEDAAEEQQAVTFKYKKADGSESTRTLSPYEVTGDITESNLKVLGWDHDRKAIRSFNIDHRKLSGVAVVDAEYVPPTS
jgi:predicted DNA-binding transcriptional regulator YafY